MVCDCILLSHWFIHTILGKMSSSGDRCEITDMFYPLLAAFRYELLYSCKNKKMHSLNAFSLDSSMFCSYISHLDSCLSSRFVLHHNKKNKIVHVVSN